jgi:ribosome-associated toxin RatA of RatAB toxin-antitoxin module
MNSHPEPAENSSDKPAAPVRRVRRRWICLGLVLLGTIVVGRMVYIGSTVDVHVFSPEELKTGPVVQVISWPNNRTAVQASQLMSLPADQVWAVVRDQAKFQEYMPYVKASSIGEKINGKYQLEQKLDLPIGLYENTLQLEEDESPAARTVRWKQLTGPLKFNEGAWVIEQHGANCILRYQLSATVNYVPQWLANYLMRKRLLSIPAAVESRVKALHKSDSDRSTSGESS